MITSGITWCPSVGWGNDRPAITRAVPTGTETPAAQIPTVPDLIEPMTPTSQTPAAWAWTEPVAWICLGLLILCFYSNPPARHFMSPFREGQTALLADQLARGQDGEGWAAWLATPTPVFGYPWELPMEFPLFQRSVAALRSTTGLPLDFLGRVANALFTVGAFVLAASFGRRVGISRSRARLLVLLGLLSPLYFGYGGAFMIEGCALFFVMLWLWAIVRCWETDSVWPWLLATVSSTIAGLVKPTTWVPAAIGISVMVLFASVGRGRVEKPRRPWQRILGTLLIMGFTVLLVKSWVDYSDVVKARNPLAAGLVSSNLNDWNYGTWAQKSSPSVWALISGKTLVLTFGLAGLVLPFAAVWWWWPARRSFAASEHGRILCAALAAATSAPLVFTNLHLQHDYYQFANGLYLWVAVALGVAWMEATGRSALADRMLAVALASCVLTTAGYLLFRQSLRDPADEAVLAALAKLPPGRPVAYLGFDYSGKLPFYSARPALMNITMQDVTSGRFAAALKLNQDLGYGAIALGGPAYLEAGWNAAATLRLPDPVLVEIFPRTMLIVPKADAMVLRQKTAVSELADPELAAVIAEAKGTGSGYHRVSLERTAAGFPCGLRIILKRRDQLFYFRSRSMNLTRIKSVE